MRDSVSEDLRKGGVRRKYVFWDFWAPRWGSEWLSIAVCGIVPSNEGRGGLLGVRGDVAEAAAVLVPTGLLKLTEILVVLQEGRPFGWWERCDGFLNLFTGHGGAAGFLSARFALGFHVVESFANFSICVSASCVVLARLSSRSKRSSFGRLSSGLG